MDKIQMVDLIGQYNRISKRIDDAVINVIRSSAYINGTEVKSFQTELESYLSVKHVIPCANGTDALQIALMSIGLKPGDEVITSDFTFAATVEVIELLGLKSRLVDVDPLTYNIDVNKIKNVITDKTKAIIPVHIFGQCADMAPILEIARTYNLKVIEDTAQAIGSEYTFPNGIVTKAGTMGDMGATSFFPSKNLGCFGDGGALFTNNDELASKARIIANHGMAKRYYHDSIGVNSRLDSVQAAVLRIKLEYLDDYIQRRRAAASFYNHAFENINWIDTPETASFTNHVFHQYTIKTKNVDRFAVQKHLYELNIPAMIYYPVPLHNQKAYSKQVKYKDDEFPVTNMLCEQVLSLPMHTELFEEQLRYICDSLIKFQN